MEIRPIDGNALKKEKGDARMTDYAEKMTELERRIEALETAFKENSKKAVPLEDKLVEEYGEYVNKTIAAQIIGVARVTVYTMLADGRIEGAYKGHKVSVRSIGRYMSRKNK